MRLAHALRSRRAARDTARALNRPASRELADLGLARADIPTVSRQASR
ncbi:TPA: DUF1127 domain-containing protein [Streptococcus pyogenes]|nr:DUF1127 domain-containing protein [Streptococcus pyogenes]